MREQVIITLTAEERALADAWGERRDSEARAEGRREAWKDDKGGSVRENHKDGVAAEIAHMKFLGVPIELTINNFKGPDVGENTEVRGTKSRWAAGKVTDRDVDSRVVVFYRQHTKRTYEQLGWLTVAEAKQIGRYLDPHDRKKWAYFVSDEDLRPVETLETK